MGDFKLAEFENRERSIMGTTKNPKSINQVIAEPPMLVTRMAIPEDEDNFLYTDESIVASLNRAREEMRQGKFIPKEDVIEDV